MGDPAKLYDDLRLPDRKPLSRPQIERDVLPAPIVDVGFNRDESLGVGAASKLVAIGGHHRACDSTRSNLTGDGVALDIFVRAMSEGSEERRVWKACGSQCRARWSTATLKKKY